MNAMEKNLTETVIISFKFLNECYLDHLLDKNFKFFDIQKQHPGNTCLISSRSQLEMKCGNFKLSYNEIETHEQLQCREWVLEMSR